MQGVERVMKAMAAAWNEALGEGTVLDLRERLAQAAMRETLLIAAEAWQAGADYEKDQHMQDVADWLKGRADEQ